MGDTTDSTLRPSIGPRDLVRRLRANDAVLIAAIERHHAVGLAPGAGRQAPQLGRRLGHLRSRGLVGQRHAAAMFAALRLRCNVDYDGATPDPAGVRDLIRRHRAVATWALARGYVTAGQLEPVESGWCRG